MENLIYTKFENINLDDLFFDSLKSDYEEFSAWFHRKNNDYAYVLYGQDGIDGFLYLKFENEVTDIVPPIYNKHILKVGTFKFNPKGTLRGQRFIKKILDIAIANRVELVYLTVFKKHTYLINLFTKYRFSEAGQKQTSNGVEYVYARNMRLTVGDILLDYPYIPSTTNKFLLAIHPSYHTRLFPESRLFNESPDIVQDVSHSNSIHKIYISAAYNANILRRGDILVIYRTGDGNGPAYHRAVVSSICLVEEVKHTSEFLSEDEYLQYCTKFSVFTSSELSSFYRERRYPYVIRFTYNMALPKRINRRELLDNNLIGDHTRIVLEPISDNVFQSILRLSQANESFIVN
ncbi:N-acetyltransferase [Mergibacter septicus]|uniref:N-acetyltransferase n=1 Tax=Mergibacter septicus TaxID=221402 RepID=A0A8D4IVY0_9PAST|nr:N-acetyltransferase [Mergibacter septicus]AWX14813.1 N-acetyltransferase [Mergibacter septicus]QDJ14065.1 N-acetyltransferase [Mergibacter septicus]UTU48487.1 N-acetyltransferase [Mergibacter septicus]WMR95884.1 N-acetyltransferase [Mergibacter septicus]